MLSPPKFSYIFVSTKRSLLKDSNFALCVDAKIKITLSIFFTFRIGVGIQNCCLYFKTIMIPPIHLICNSTKIFASIKKISAHSSLHFKHYLKSNLILTAEFVLYYKSYTPKRCAMYFMEHIYLTRTDTNFEKSQRKTYHVCTKMKIH